MEEFEDWGDVFFTEEETREILDGFKLGNVWEHNPVPKHAKNGNPIFDRNRSYTYTQAAEFLGVSVRTVMREVKANRLIVHKVRGCTRIHGADLLAYKQEGKCS